MTVVKHVKARLLVPDEVKEIEEVLPLFKAMREKFDAMDLNEYFSEQGERGRNNFFALLHEAQDKIFNTLPDLTK